MYIIQPFFLIFFIPSFYSFIIFGQSHMTRRKGKRKASPSPSPSSSSVDNDDAHSVPKRLRHSSPARVRQVALAKVGSKSKSDSSSKVLAGFAALVNNSNLSAARAETSRGLRSSSRFRRIEAKSRDEKTVRIFI